VGILTTPDGRRVVIPGDIAQHHDTILRRTVSDYMTLSIRQLMIDISHRAYRVTFALVKNHLRRRGACK
jgi:hypothetical protein